MFFNLACICQVFYITDFEKQCKDIVNVLCSDSLEGRKAGTLGDKKSQVFLLNRIKKLKVRSFYSKNYIQPFSYSKDTGIVYTSNIVYWIDNKATKNLFFVAHFDHLGFGGEKSRSYTRKAIHPGANDNATGVCMILALSRWYSHKFEQKRWKQKLNFVFVLLSGHEDGLYGSNYLVQNLPQHVKSNILLVINFDMIGRLLYTSGRIEIYDPLKFIDRNILPDNSSVKVDIRNEDILADQKAFINENIPAITISTGMFDDYHRITDTPDKIDFKGIYEIFMFTTQLVNNIYNAKVNCTDLKSKN
ncbi:MAG: M28 family peptidase [Bacteroidales bacterium]|nr:M28 family peptidase [Bacteroidales bacterium]